MRKKNIKNILDKFIHGSLSREEQYLLYHLVNNDLHEEEIKAWFYKHWDETPLKKSDNRSFELLEKIKNKIDLPATSFKNVKPRFETHFHKRRLWLTLSGFAAVFIIGFIVAYFFIRQSGYDVIQEKIIYNELDIPIGSKSKITLSDGTQIWLNAGSTLKYPSKFSDKKREIFFEGEAFFDVSKDKNRPFIVRTSEINIRVLGTKFNVKSYPEDNIIEATLVSGSIEIETRRTVSASGPSFF